MRKDSVTCILNGYKRPESLEAIHDALQQQTLKPVDIRLWYNNPCKGESQHPINHDLIQGLGGAFSNRNLGVWARFAYALLADTEYICVFDDDTVPGSRWLENCYTTITQPQYEGLLGTIGLIFNSRRSYSDHGRVGWSTANPCPVQVDLVGHSWFFKREWLYLLFKDPPMDPLAGEDIQFSFVLQKYLGLKTFVPPHPVEDRSLWGSLYAREMGSNPDEAIHLRADAAGRFEKCFDEALRNGWKLLCDGAAETPASLERTGGPDAAGMRRDFRGDLEVFFKMLESGRNFALTRYGDGELALIEGRPIGRDTQAYTVDGWEFEGGVDNPFSRRLRQTLSHTEEDFFYLIPCQCCNNGAKQAYLELLRCPPQNISFANLFINANYRHFIPRLISYLGESRRPCVVLANAKTKRERLRDCVDVAEYYLLEGDVVEGYNESPEVLEADVRDLAQRHQDTVFIFALGPLSEILIDTAYRTNPRNVYLDLGSSVDELLYGETTRPYQFDSEFSRRECVF